MLWLNDVADYLVPDWYIDMMESFYRWEYQVNASELTDHVEKYREGILQGQKVLVVSHSQGNFYINQARQILASQQPSVPMESFGIFGVATPANNIGGNNAPYLTNHRDVILLVPGSLPSNWTLRHTNDGRVADDRERAAAHGFNETYLSPAYNIRPELIAGIKQRLSGLQDPPEVVGSGPVTVTMTWNLGSNDVDLHVFEPDQTHVYYEYKSGISGYLDVDNVDGFGPEHYYTDCNQLQVGQYSVGVNYYDDHDDEDEDDSKPARPVTATVTISVPGATRTFTITLSDDIQSAGNPNPLILAVVTVERISDPNNPNQDGKLKYKIDQVFNG